MTFVQTGTFRALRHRNFRLYMFGQLLSVAGTWMQRVAQAWLAYRLTGSAGFLGLVAFTSSAPAFFLSPLAGIVADQGNRKRLLMVTQSLAMLQSFALAAATLGGYLSPVQLLGYAFFLGAINAFDNPTRQSFYLDMVSREDLSNAIALNSSMVNTARIVGPAVTGLVVAAYGEGVCFLVNALSFLAVLVALFFMRVDSRAVREEGRSRREMFREGYDYVRRTPLVRALLTLFAMLNLAGTPYATLLPIFAGSVLKTGPTGLGWLLAASGVGAIVCTLTLASRSDARGLPWAVMAAAFVFAGALILLGLSKVFTLSLLLMSLIGGGYNITLASTQTLLQACVPDALRGRVMSFYSLIFLGFPPFGNLIAGWVAERAGAPLTVSLCGVLSLAGALIFARSQVGASRDRALPA